jgi:hypothetical protein
MEAERITGRLTFLGTLAELWKLAAVVSAAPASGPTGAPGKRPAGGSEPQPASSSAPSAERDQVLAAWLQQATTNRARLLKLLSAAGRYPIPPPRGTHESLVEYDRRRGIKEMLLEQIIAICVETADAARVIRTMMHDPPPGAGMARWERPAERVLRALMRGDAAGVRRQWRDLIGSLAGQPLLYVALARGGNPQRIVASRGLQTMLRRLLAYLPRLGLLRETKQLIEAVQEMEMGHPVGPGAITEFDQVFKIGCKAIVRSLVASSNGWRGGRGRATLAEYDTDLIGFLEQTTEALLRSWLMHSRGVRLSVLETVSDKARWHELKGFIERYGHDLFTQRFMNLGNLRAILHEGVENYLRALAEEPGAEDEYRLLAELDGPLSRDEAVQWLTVALEAVVENYGEYVDYNSTTTQSDRGEMLYTLLDFLRLRTGYDRVAWNLQPVVLTHEVLVRSGREDAAEIWRSAVGERTAEIAEDYLRRFVRLNRKYGMRLPSIADRLGERFIRPLLVDRLRALVQPAIEETIGPRPGEEEKGRKPRPVKRKAAGGAFARLEDGIEQFAREVSGAGFDVPAWLESLEQEVERVQSQEAEDEEMPWPDFPVPEVRLSKEEVRRQVRAMMEK